MKKNTLIYLFILSIFVGLPTLLDANPLNQAEETKIIAIKMDADWCGKCKVMNPKLESIKPQFEDQPVLFVKFNMTDSFTTKQAGLLAERMNLYSIFETHQGRTGFMVLVDAATGEVLKTLQSGLSEEQLISEISELL